MSTPSVSVQTPGLPSVLYPPPPPAQMGYSFREASLGIRAIAAVVDLVILAIIAIGIALPLGLLTAWAVLSGSGTSPWFALIWGPTALVMFAVFIIYFTLLESNTGQTLGKRVFDLRVVSTSTGRPPDLGHSLIRNILRIVDWLPFLYLLGFIVAALGSKRQRLGDLLAETVVVRA